MEHGIIEREIHIEAAPEVVYDVVSRPEHLRQWWPDQAELDPVPGGIGRVTFGDGSTPDAVVETLTVVEADRPRRFSFFWVSDEGSTAGHDNSLLVTFDLEPAQNGTLLRFSESGFREKGWEAAVLEEHYRDHVSGWDHFLPRLVSYVDRLVATP
jgi:uncharacterized protein YndB with AHSA1/START domain